MSTIATTEFKVSNAANFINSNDVRYAFIGKSDSWDTTLSGSDDSAIPSVKDTLEETQDAFGNMIAAKKVNADDYCHVVPRYNWEYGKVYSQWDDANENLIENSSNPFFVLNSDLNLYKCLYSPLDLNRSSVASTVEPTHLPTFDTLGAFDSNSDIATTSDGYVWKFMYKITANDLKFLSEQFVPLRTYTSDAGLDAEELFNYNAQQASADNDGKIYSVLVTDVGSNYTGNATVNLFGDGSGAVASATMAGDNTIAYITVSNNGSGYNRAYATLTGTADELGSARMVLSPKGGHGTNPVEELGGFYVGISAILKNEPSVNDLDIDTSYRQVGLIENPLKNSVAASDDTLSALVKLEVVMTNATEFNQGDYVTASGGGIAYVDAVQFVSSGGAGGVDGDTYNLFVHQNDKTGYGNLSGTLSGNNGAGASISTETASEMDKYKGRIIFLENRTVVVRNPNQTEDIRFVIEF